MGERRRIVLSREVGLALLIAGAALSALSCGGNDVTAPTTGSLTITTSTTGAEPDADGYAITVDEGSATAIPVSGTLQRDNVEPGNHNVLLTRMAANCTVAGENPRTVAVPAGETVTITFELTCSATTGSLQITSATSGASPDADGYTMTVDGADRGTLVASGAVTLDGLPTGSHSVGLSGVAGNCQVQGDNPRSITIVAGATATAAFDVVCAAPPAVSGSLKITTATTGLEPDPDGYSLAIDAGATQAIGQNTTTTVTNVAAGAHQVRLSKVANNCKVGGSNPRPVTIAAGVTTQVSFTITCVLLPPTTGTLQITTTTTGSEPDPDGYTTSVDHGAGQSIGINASVNISNVSPGAHAVELTGIADNCHVVGDNPSSVTVVAGAQATAAFSLECPSPALQWQATGLPGDHEVVAIWGSSATDIYAIATVQYSGDSGELVMFHSNGQTWSAAESTGVAGRLPMSPYAIWGSAANDIFLVGSDSVRDAVAARYDGHAFSQVARLGVGGDGTGRFAYFLSVWGTSSADVFAVGPTSADGILWHPVVAHYDGTSWSRMSLPGDDYSLLDVFGTSSHDVYAVGGGTAPTGNAGFLLHYDGSQWTEMPIDYPGNFWHLGAVWASSPNDVFAVGALNNRTGLIFHYDGHGWSPMAVPATDILTDVWGTSSSNVFAVSWDAILHYDGKAWTKVSNQGGYAIWGSSSRDVYVVTKYSSILHGTPIK
jgi:hypothetical protein